MLHAVTNANNVDGFMHGTLNCKNIRKSQIACGILIYEVIKPGKRTVSSNGFIDTRDFARGLTVQQRSVR